MQQRIDIKIHYAVDDNGYKYEGKIGPNVERISTIFGGGGPVHKHGHLEDLITTYRERLIKLYPDRPQRFIITFPGWTWKL